MLPDGSKSIAALGAEIIAAGNYLQELRRRGSKHAQKQAEEVALRARRAGGEIEDHPRLGRPP